MAKAAIVLRVLISSPSDVAAESATVRMAILDWNSAHLEETGIMLEPVQWQTHAYPASGDRPQALINKQIVDQSDMVIAVFGHRIGSATGVAESGTTEEIERVRKDGKYVAVYFSTAPLPRDYDREQFQRLEKYRESLEKNTLCWPFDTSEELYRLVSQHLVKGVSQVHEELRSSGTISALALKLPGFVKGAYSMRAFSTRSPYGVVLSSGEPLKLQHVFVGQFPDGPTLRLTANKEFILTQLDYVDENGVRISSAGAFGSSTGSQPVEGKGFQLEIHIDRARLMQIHNLKPRRDNAAIPMQFRLHLTIDGHAEERNISALLRPEFKVIGDTRTFFMNLVG